MKRLTGVAVLGGLIFASLSGSHVLAGEIVAKQGRSSGLAAHYYRDPLNWGGNWPDTVGAPTVSPAKWTFSKYAYTRIESLVNHQFVKNGWFTVRWQGILDTHPRTSGKPGAAEYEFEFWADDGCRLFINGKKLIDSWIPCSEDSPQARRKVKVVLEPGEHEIVVEYFQGQSLKGGDRDPAKLYWSCPARKIPRQIVPAAHFSHTVAHTAPEAGRQD
jgi:hypothetical protein